ncbi:MAG: hypothetical protein P4M11_07595 [Candidatus Pacebacteria bacterium]|nr:hypothetical protein [Candidatus Paceibacterota bacterium]
MLFIFSFCCGIVAAVFLWVLWLSITFIVFVVVVAYFVILFILYKQLGQVHAALRIIAGLFLLGGAIAIICVAAVFSSIAMLLTVFGLVLGIIALVLIIRYFASVLLDAHSVERTVSRPHLLLLHLPLSDIQIQLGKQPDGAEQ